MMVVEDLREPFVIQHAVDVFGLGLRGGEEVTVVVVADVFLIEAWQPGQRPLDRVRVAHVPVSHEIIAVRVRVHEQDDALVEQPHRLVIRTADHLEYRLRELLGAERLSGVQAAVDPHDRLAFAREDACLLVGEPFGEREPP